MKKDRVCSHCKVLFKNIEGRVFSNHVKWCEKNPNNSRRNSTRKIISDKAKENESLKNGGDFKWFEVSCHKCGVNFCIKERERKFPLKEKYFCCRSCANSRKNSGPQTEESKKRVSEKSKEWWKDSDYSKKVLNNNKRFSSKGEVDLRNFFIQTCPEDEWTSGGPISLEEYYVTARDLYSKKLMVCIEYDGIWHFEDIHGQLKLKQKKDNLLERWCIKNNYRLIRIDEDLYKQNPSYWKHLILDEAYNGTKQIVKFGYKYQD